jgi:hypothetical protein
MNWLINQVEPQIIDELRHLSIPQYADECFQAIKQIVVNQGHTKLGSEWKRLLPALKPKAPAQLPAGTFKLASDLIDHTPKIVNVIFESIEAQVDDLTSPSSEPRPPSGPQQQ